MSEQSGPDGAAEASLLDLPEELIPLSWLIGRWAGVGLGHYPTIEDFRFGQEVSFITDGRPFLSYASRSWLLDEAPQSRGQAWLRMGMAILAAPEL